jgi:hypothetical protein
LEVEQGLKSPLRDFGLVGRVLGVPAGVFEDIALYHGRYDTSVIPLADIRSINLVLCRHRLGFTQKSGLIAYARQIEVSSPPNAVGYRAIDKRFKARRPHGMQHFRHFAFAWPEMA